MSTENFKFEAFDVKCMSGEMARTEIIHNLNYKIGNMYGHYVRYKTIRTQFAYDTLKSDLSDLVSIVRFLHMVDFISTDVYKKFNDFIDGLRKELQKCI